MPCWGKEARGIFVGLVSGLRLCSPAPSGIRLEGEGGQTHCRGRSVRPCSSPGRPTLPQPPHGRRDAPTPRAALA